MKTFTFNCAKKAANIGFFLLLLTLSAACGKERETEHTEAAEAPVESVFYEDINDQEAMVNKKNLDSLYDAKFDGAKHPKIKVGVAEYYLAEGDLLLTEYQFTQYKISKLRPADSLEGRNKLVVMRVNGKDVRWPENYQIRYCINKNSFRTAAEYELVKKNMKSAASDWEKTCNVRFYHDEQQDGSGLFQPNATLTFVVLGYESEGEFIASAFFPNDPVQKRHLLIDPTYFDFDFDGIGVLRHELGHVLGFRHEHIRAEAPAICQGESTQDAANQTTYDPRSVMHYFCGGIGTLTLQITDIDREGSQKIYGIPLAD